jgi:hypothetical protein
MKPREEESVQNYLLLWEEHIANYNYIVSFEKEPVHT